MTFLKPKMRQAIYKSLVDSATNGIPYSDALAALHRSYEAAGCLAGTPALRHFLATAVQEASGKAPKVQALAKQVPEPEAYCLGLASETLNREYLRAASMLSSLGELGHRQPGIERAMLLVAIGALLQDYRRRDALALIAAMDWSTYDPQIGKVGMLATQMVAALDRGDTAESALMATYPPEEWLLFGHASACSDAAKVYREAALALVRRIALPDGNPLAAIAA